ncbi:MAG: 2-oxo acid dehydrogenase subunit E2 [Gammaproteobacteria bacterium]|nr:MAG: 2-oxo acid dehydrogenase subunit E2 [Gammaproteobacteria bacterium]
MRKPVTMPALSDTMQTGQLVRWLKAPGDPVKRGEPIAEVESDKAVMELESFEDGWLAGPLAETGVDIPVGTPIAWVTDDPSEATTEAGTEAGEPPAAPREPAEEAAPSAPPAEPAPTARTSSATDTDARHSRTQREQPATPPPPRSEGEPPASPAARRLAAMLGLALGQIPPGPDGIIHEREVMAAALGRRMPAGLDAGPPWRIKLPTPMQRAVAENMSRSLAIPVFHLRCALPLAPLRELAHERGLSLTLLFARALARTLEEHPRMNAAWTPLGLALRERVDMGIAVDVPHGLVTPVLRDVARRPLQVLAEDWTALKQRAQEKRLAPQDYQGATCYLSNLGMFPAVQEFDAILPEGASLILALAAEHDGGASATLTCDHRVVYGADAARMVQDLVGLLESPNALTTD